MNFHFWEPENQAIHLVNVLRAINAAYSNTYASTPIVDAAKAATTAAKAAYEYAAKAVPNPRSADVFSMGHDVNAAAAHYAACFVAHAAARAASSANDAFAAAVSTYDASTNALNGASVGAEAAFAALSDAERYSAAATNNTGITADSANFDSTAPLWGTNRPAVLFRYEHNLIRGMERLGLHYWVRQYQGWIKGEFDWQQMRRCLEMQEEFTLSVEAMMGYLEAAEQGKQRHLDEARVLIIGEGEVGKTSLLNYLLDRKLAEPSEPSTPGVAVRENEEHIGERKLRVHYWDFGGQLHLHPTHQFFMRSRCVYLLVVNARTENACAPQVEYWLEHVRIFGRGAPTLIVQNKVDESQAGMKAKPSFDMREIIKRYPFVRAFLNLSCKSGAGRKELQAEINKLLSEHRILDGLTPTTWFDLKERLRAEPNPYINRERYYELCELSSVTEDDGKRGALDALDQLGVALNFPDVDDDLFVLKPEWVTDIVYHIINKSAAEHWDGRLNAERLKIIFDRNKYPNAPEVKPDKLRAILRLLKQFDLAFDIGNEDYCAPMLIDSDSKADDFPMEHRLNFTVTMPALLPPALFYRFITQCGKAREIDGDKLWRRGCVLARGEVSVLVEYRINERRISLSVCGEKQPAGQYLSVLRLRLFDLCGKFEGLEYEAKVSGPDFDSIPFKALLHSFQDNIQTMVDGNGKRVAVQDTADQIFGGQPTLNEVLRELASLRIENRILYKLLERPLNVIISQTQTQTQTQTQSVEVSAKIDNQWRIIDDTLATLFLKGESLGGQQELLRKIKSLQGIISDCKKDKTKNKGILETIKSFAGTVQDSLKGIKGFADLAKTMRDAVVALEGLLS